MFELEKERLPIDNINKRKRPNICVISSPFQYRSGKLSLSKFMKIIERTSNETFLITGSFYDSPTDEIKIYYINGDIKDELMFLRIFKYFIAQLSISYILFILLKKIDIIILCLNTSTYVLPIIFLRLTHKKIMLLSTECAFKCSEGKYDRRLCGLGILIPRLLKTFEQISYRISDRIIVYSKFDKEYLNINKYDGKIFTEGAWYVDVNKFNILKQFDARRNRIGFVGRFNKEKGIINFLNSLSFLENEIPDLEFFVAGYGDLLEEIKIMLKSNDINKRVILNQWIDHNDLPNYLNEIKIIVIPSYSEGLPNILLESMACGTLVLATSVGSIPELIIDEQTGFILADNSPECIASNVIRALNHPNIEGIIRNSRELVLSKYSFEASVDRYIKIIDDDW